MSYEVPKEFDCQWQVTFIGPETIAVDFYEEEDEAIEAGKAAVVPSVSVYVSRVIRQGEHKTRSTSRHLAVFLELSDEERKAVEHAAQRQGMPKGRKGAVRFLTQILKTAIGRI